MSKISKGLWAICKLKKYVNSKTQVVSHYSLAHSRLQNCISSFGSAPKTTLKPLFNLQEKIIRFITYSDFQSSPTPLFKKLHLLTLDDIHKLRIAMRMLKISDNIVNACSMTNLHVKN